MQTIEETYRLTDEDSERRERGLLQISTTMTEGGALYAHRISVFPLNDREGLPAGDYRAEFVKREASADLYGRISRRFSERANDPRRPR